MFLYTHHLSQGFRTLTSLSRAFVLFFFVFAQKFQKKKWWVQIGWTFTAGDSGLSRSLLKIAGHFHWPLMGQASPLIQLWWRLLQKVLVYYLRISQWGFPSTAWDMGDTLPNLNAPWVTLVKSANIQYLEKGLDHIKCTIWMKVPY